MAKAARGSFFIQGSAGIGDGDEVGAGRRYSRLGDLTPEVVEEGIRLAGSAGLARNHKQRPPHVHGIVHVLHGAGMGAIEHVQPQPAGHGAKGDSADVGTETAAAHAEHDRIRVALTANRVGKRPDLFHAGPPHSVNDVQPAQPVPDSRLNLRIV